MPMSVSACLRHAAPQAFYAFAGRLVPWIAACAALAAAAGLYVAFLVVPTDPRQGEVYRIIFVHVPAAWMSMLVYLLMAFWAALGLSLNNRLWFMMAHALAPTGALFAFLALWTGAIWGKPAWGAWWVWDARLTSELILLLFYLGYVALNASVDDARRADRACALLALVGAVNVPIVYYSVQWWNSLHQGVSASLTRAPSMAATMLTGMLLMTLAFSMYTLAVALARVRCVILEREQDSAWAGAQFGPALRPRAA
jgi:heme exporter protein C